ncbi:amino acid adenylation domain-containing protein [Streptomyces sp. NPDC047117]|uniref:non-ribosomal peptide synthetase n=1 Tax=Streptomyces sp. NPDC047117 TaxID=3155379 RepID=UPI00340592A1
MGELSRAANAARSSTSHDCVHRLFVTQAERTPDAIAVRLRSDRLTYRELDRQSNRIANSLIARGINRGALVAVQLDRSIELVAALLGILKAGAAYVPIDVHTPTARRESILRQTRAGVLITHSGTDTTACPESCHPLFLDDLGTWRDHADSPPSVRTDPADVVYVLFTSGTTGAPKGVVVEHAGVVNILSWMIREYGFTPGDRVLQKTPYTFDASVWEFFVPLLSGGTVVLAEPDGHRDPGYLARAVREYGVTTLQLVPSMLRHVLAEPVFTRCSSLRQVFCGGEALPLDLQNRFFERMPVPLHNLYGPTETSVQVMTWTCRPDDARPYVPIGRPVDNILTRVLDPSGRHVAAGEAGELYIGGIAVAREYLGDRDRTARHFVTDPGSMTPELPTRFYRTGDLVREHEDGTFEFLGRLDEQIKVQGFRVEPGEIETRLRQFPAVRNAAVLAEENIVVGSTRLVAYLETEAAAIDLRRLRDHLAEHLPAYMVPTLFRAVDALPLSRHGKLDRALLSRLPHTVIAGPSEAEESADGVENTLIRIWREILDVPSVGVRDDFFELGGDSMAGLMLIAEAKSEGLSITPHDLFTLRRLDALAAHCRNLISG